MSLSGLVLVFSECVLWYPDVVRTYLMVIGRAMLDEDCSGA